MSIIERDYNHHSAFAELSYEALLAAVEMTKKIIGLVSVAASAVESEQRCVLEQAVEQSLESMLASAREIIDFNCRPTIKTLFLERPIMDDTLFYQLVLSARDNIKARVCLLRKARAAAQSAIGDFTSGVQLSGCLNAQLIAAEKIVDAALPGLISAVHRQAHIWL